MFYLLKAGIRGCFYNSIKFSFKRSYIYDNVKISHLNKINLGYKSTIGFNTIINAQGKYINLGKESIIQHNSLVELFNGYLDIEDNVSIGVGAFLSCNGGVSIGKYTRIGPGVKIIAASHNYLNSDLPIMKQGLTKKGILIGENVWIGANVVILDGSEIKDNCIIAAGTVVNGKVLESGIIYGGAPVRKIKEIEYE